MKLIAAITLAVASISAQAAVVENFNLGELKKGQSINYSHTFTTSGAFEHHLNFNFAGPAAGGSGGASGSGAKWGLESTITFTNIGNAAVGLFKKGGAGPVMTFKAGQSNDWTAFGTLAGGEYYYQVIGNAAAGAKYTLNAANVAPVPEPETYALMGLGLVSLFAARRRRTLKAL